MMLAAIPGGHHRFLQTQKNFRSDEIEIEIEIEREYFSLLHMYGYVFLIGLSKEVMVKYR